MHEYYTDKLSGERLKKCYKIAPARVQQYLNSEIDYVLDKIRPQDTVLELGCGYGRILPALAAKAEAVIGIDTSPSSIRLCKELLGAHPNITFLQMNAIKLGFEDGYFDVVLCLQNGISAFHVNKLELIREAVRVTKRGGIALFSSYSDKFWVHRLNWFELQSGAGLIGEIDHEKTKDGIIVCKDGFTATTVSTNEFSFLTANIKDIEVGLSEIDNSSIFCEISPTK